MRIPQERNSTGFALLELLMVFTIIGAMASIAIPHYASYSDRAKAARCLANRYHIEMEERAYFLDHNKASLKIDDKWSCPSGGVYVWLISDPSDPGFPKVVCSIHGSGESRVEEALEGLVADWSLDEGKGDTIGQGENTGKVTGAQWAEGKVGIGLKFDGHSKDYLSVGPSSGVQLTGDLTVSLWVRLDSMGGKKVSLFTCKGSGEKESANVLYELQMDKKGRLYYQHEYGKGKNQKGTFRSAGITTDSWNLVTLTRDTSSKTVEVYVNGSDIGSYAYKHNPTGGGSSVLYLGSDVPKKRKAIDGTIDEVGIYDRVLGPEEIKSYYEKTR